SSQNAASQTSSAAAVQRKPRLALFIATVCGLGYLPVAPGTWGSLAGVIIWALILFFPPLDMFPGVRETNQVRIFWLVLTALPVAVILAIMGVWASDRASQFARLKDPQFVVIDEVSGQHLALFLGAALPIFRSDANSSVEWLGVGGLSLKYLLLGFILFRAFDIWKPFPARQAESLPGGWGIMADDWVAGIYAAIGLWLARAAGL
ncbi:MAG TPA: phosphatidylglycerophosphatase A, partial [Candidatus Limnocylindrales bacterium]|nr:phosphatidylglycerophosphatase A [Candidatus Limnocylindrales bacterium]